MTPPDSDTSATRDSATRESASRSASGDGADSIFPTSSAATPSAPVLAEFEQVTGGQSEVPLSMLFSLTLPISIELGRTTMSVQEILRLGRGSVVQLDRLAGQPIDVFVGDRRFAEGEVVVLGEHFGVRITRIISRGGTVGAQDAA